VLETRKPDPVELESSKAANSSFPQKACLCRFQHQSTVIMSTTEFEKSGAVFRQHLPDLNTPRFQVAKDQNAYEYAEAFQKTHYPPWFYTLTGVWARLLKEPYIGVTTDGAKPYSCLEAYLDGADKARIGNVIPNLFQAQDEGIPIDRIVAAVERVLGQITAEQKSKLQYPLNAKEWRAWSNPEFLLRPFGLRLEELDKSVAVSILAVLEATFSPEGYQKALGAMRINGFLGDICNVPKVMNVYSYNFLLFGTPSTDGPWGFSLYGHHLCINVFLYGRQIVISPTFTGAEPNVIDSGPFSGTEILHVEGEVGLKLMQSFPDPVKHKAQTFKLLRDPGMLQTGDLTKDRWTPDDQRQVCGAFQDNRIVPEEGVVVSDFTVEQQQQILDLVEQFTVYLPHTARKLRLEQVRKHFDKTHFSWIGSWGDDDPFYYRIQSPVIICEFDHHSGVFLSNKEPAKFHTHTILRMPNAGDYGCALRKPEDQVQ
jgi:hypothetical protein